MITRSDFQIMKEDLARHIDIAIETKINKILNEEIEARIRSEVKKQLADRFRELARLEQ